MPPSCRKKSDYPTIEFALQHTTKSKSNGSSSLSFEAPGPTTGSGACEAVGSLVETCLVSAVVAKVSDGLTQDIIMHNSITIETVWTVHRFNIT